MEEGRMKRENQFLCSCSLFNLSQFQDFLVQTLFMKYWIAKVFILFELMNYHLFWFGQKWTIIISYFQFAISENWIFWNFHNNVIYSQWDQIKILAFGSFWNFFLEGEEGVPCIHHTLIAKNVFVYWDNTKVGKS